MEKMDNILLNLIPREFCQDKNIVPLSMENNKVNILCTDNFDEKHIPYLKFLLKKDINLIKKDKNHVDALLKKYHCLSNSSNTLNKKNNEFLISKENVTSPYVEFVEELIITAIEKRASDIHIEPFKKQVLVRLRVLGVLQEEVIINRDDYEGVIGRIKILTNMDITEKRKFQDGKMSFNYSSKEYDLRTSIIPTINGEKLVIRILYKDTRLISLNELKYNETVLKYLTKELKNQGGIILVTGPTGSGKTTSLYAMLNYLNNEEVNITTIEDPVEYTIRGINQVNVNYSQGITFSSGLRSTLRQDPDVIMIGEIRDEETAKIAIRSAITGHLVLSTLHTNNAIGAINRLQDMGIEKYLLYDAVKLVISQRLVKVLCSNCKTIIENKNEALGIKSSFISKGCDKCNFKGVVKRQLVSEVMVIDKKEKKHICLETLENDIKNKIKDGTISLEEGRSYLNL